MTPGSQDEIREFADAMFDGTITGRNLQRLDELIVNDAFCLQAYLELMNLHGELFFQANFYSDEQAALGVLREFSRACDRQQRRTRRREVALVTASVLAVMALLVWLPLMTLFQPKTLGSVAFLTHDANLYSGQLELGEILHAGKTLFVDAGVISVQLPNVLVDLIGPAELKFVAENQVHLKQGTLAAHVLPGGKGFTVLTSDAEVVDLGTEFLVQYKEEQGTNVAVRQGRAQVRLLNAQGQPTRLLELTAHRSAHLHRLTNQVKETEFLPESFELIDQSRGGIRRVDGNVRTAGREVRSLRGGSTTTPNYLLIIPECQNVLLQEELVLEGLEGPVRLPAGTIVSSYLLHYDSPPMATTAPRGAVTFFEEIAAVVASEEGLRVTDPLFGLAGTRYETGHFRSLELDEDEILVSGDRQTVSFYCGVSPPHYLDEARIIITSRVAP